MSHKVFDPLGEASPKPLLIASLNTAAVTWLFACHIVLDDDVPRIHKSGRWCILRVLAATF